MSKFKDETGKVYGRLTVLSQSPGHYYANTGSASWYCRCECGETTIVTGYNLRRGGTKSCGCLREEVTRTLGKRSVGRPRKHAKT